MSPSYFGRSEWVANTPRWCEGRGGKSDCINSLLVLVSAYRILLSNKDHIFVNPLLIPTLPIDEYVSPFLRYLNVYFSLSVGYFDWNISQMPLKATKELRLLCQLWIVTKYPHIYLTNVYPS